MRIGTQSYFDRVRRDMSRFQQRLGDLTVRLSSGKRVLTPSDDPAASLTISQAKVDLAAGESRKLALEAGRGLCRATDASLTTVVDSLTEAIDAARNVVDSTAGEQARSAVASLVRSSVQTIFTAANSSFAGRYLFGGYQDRSAPFEQAGAIVSYVGDTQRISVPVGDGGVCPVTFSGDQVFNFDPGGGRAVPGVDADVFELMESLATALEDGRVEDAASDIDDLQTLRAHVTELRGDIGGCEKRVEAAYDAALDAEQQCNEVIEERESLDLAAAISDYSALETNYQALLGVVSRIAEMPSLFDLM